MVNRDGIVDKLEVDLDDHVDMVEQVIIVVMWTC